MRLIILYIIIYILGTFSPVLANEQDKLSLEYPFTNLTTKNGLPSNETFCVFQDSRGYIWIGTDRGLVKYDGYEFKTYTTLDGLNDNVIFAIKEDSNGNIWYTGFNTLKLGYIDPNMKFFNYEYNDNLIESINGLGYPIIYFNDIYIDDKDIYLVNKRYGYVLLDQNGVQNIDIRTNGKELHQDTKTKIFDNGKVKFAYSYFGSISMRNKPINVFNTDSVQVITYNKRRFRDIYPTLVENESLYFIYDGEDCLTIDETIGKHRRLPYQCSAYKIGINQYVYSTYNLGDNNGLVYYSNSSDINNDKVILLNEDVRVEDVIQDNQGGIWLATLRNGIYYIPQLYSTFYNTKDPIESMFYSNEGLFLMNNKEACYYYDINSDVIVDSTIDTQYRGFADKAGKFSFFGHIFINMDLKSKGKLIDLTGIKGGHVFSDSLRYLWAAGYNFKIKKDSIDYCFNTIEYPYLPKQQSLFCFKEDSCLIGTSDGVYLYHVGDTVIDLNREKAKRVRQIEYFKTTKTLVYGNWGEGIVLDYEGDKYTKLSDKDGLVSNTINTMYMDENEQLWIGTNKGVNKLSLDSSTGEYSISTISNGSKNLSSPNILQIYYRDSNLYLGTDSGFDIINLAAKTEKAQIPLILDSLYINDNCFKPTNQFNSLRYDSNTLTFYYTAITYNRFGDLKYRYKLEGLSDNWVYTKDRKATFIQLNPGEYTFHLQVQDEEGRWIKLETKPYFYIKKPYWRTWWFIGIVILLGVLIIGGILYYYITNLNKEKIFIEDKQRLSEELNETQQKALSSQLNPHFVFNSLNSIQNFILTKRTELSSDYLSMFSKLMRFVFENSKKLYVPLQDEIEALNLYLELEQVRHNHKFNYKIHDESLKNELIYLPSLLIQPLIENSIWHGLLHKLEDDRKLDVVFSIKEAYLNIEIRDNGVGRGFSKPRPKFIQKQKSSGIELTKQRLNLLAQSLNIETNMKINDLFDSDKQPIGTSVIITIPVIRQNSSENI